MLERQLCFIYTSIFWQDQLTGSEKELHATIAISRISRNGIEMKRLCFTVLGAVALLGGCAHQPMDKEESAFHEQVTDAILLGKGRKVRPYKVVYLANPRYSPYRVLLWGVRRDLQGVLQMAYGRYVLRKGWTILCIRDREKNKVVITLVHNGEFLSFRFDPPNSPRSRACRAKGGAA